MVFYLTCSISFYFLSERYGCGAGFPSPRTDGCSASFHFFCRVSKAFRRDCTIRLVFSLTDSEGSLFPLSIMARKSLLVQTSGRHNAPWMIRHRVSAFVSPAKRSSVARIMGTAAPFLCSTSEQVVWQQGFARKEDSHSLDGTVTLPVI